MEKILVVDDEQSLREVLSIMLKRAGYAVTSVADGEDAIEQIQKEIFDLVITDLRMPKVDGMEVLKAVKSTSPETVVLLITAFATADSAVEAMKQGAYDFLTKPTKLAMIAGVLSRVAEKKTLTHKAIALENRLKAVEGSPDIVGSTPVEVDASPRHEIQLFA